MKVDKSEAKIIHWDYEKSPESISKIDNYYSTVFAYDEYTKIKNGIRFKFVVRFYKGEKVTLSCICEQLFMSYELPLFQYSDILTIIEMAVKDFNKVYNERYYQQTGLRGTSIFHTVKEQEVVRLLKLLQE